MKTKIISRKIGHTTKGRAEGYYGKDNIKTSKIVIKSNGKVKTVTYGPKTNYGTQTKTKVKTKRGLTY